MYKMLRNALITPLLLNAFMTVIIGFPAKKSYKSCLEEPAVQKFRQYLQIDTSEGKNSSECFIFFTLFHVF